MQLAVHTYGHIDAMFYVLNGIAMLMNHSVTMMIIEMTSLVSVSYYGLKMAYAGSSGQHKAYLMKVAAMVLMINAALLPKGEMLIIDHVSKKKEKVDNLPLGFALPVGLLEAFGDILTGGFEQAFTGLKTANYRDYGMVFGARLVQEARNWRIKSPEFIQNMHAYMTRCVVRDAMIGYHYTANDLLTTGDIWKLVSSNAGTLRKVDMRKGKEWDLVSCKEAAIKYIAPAFSSEIKQLVAKNKNSEFALATSNEKLSSRSSEIINNMLGKNIELVFGSYLGVSSSAEELIKQQMMINALSYIGDDYGYARASMQQESNWQIAGDLASTYLPILLTVIKGLLYSSFMFMVPLMLLSGGGGRYLNYLLVVGSLQLWPALNSVLNMFIDLYSSSALSDIADSIVSFSTFSQVGKYADKIVAVASGLQMSVPFLSFAIVQGGVAGFIHLAGNITGASQAASSSVASEIATGNRSIDNVSAGNRQIGMQSGFKSDWNQAYASGGSSYQHMDGTMERVVGSGDMMLQSGVGLTVSGGSSRFNVTESVSSQLERSLSNAQSLMDSDQRAYSKASATTFDNTASLVASLAKRESMGESIDYAVAGEHGKALQKAVSQTRQLNEKYDYGWRQSAESLLKGGLNATFSKVGGLPFIGAEGGASLSIGANNLSEQSVSDNNQLSRENNAHIDYSSVVKAASNEQFARSNNIDTSYSDDIRKSYQEQQSLEGQIAKRAEQIETYNRALSHVQSKDASFEQDMYHVLEQKVASAYGVSTKDAHDMIERGDPRVIAIKQKMISDEVSNYLPALESGRERTAPNTTKQELDGFNTRYQRQYDFDRQRSSQVDPFYSKDIQDMAQKKGIDTSNKDLGEDTIAEKVSILIHDNTQEINQVQKQNQQTEERLQEQVKQYEKDRIGQGLVSKILSGGMGIGGATNPATIEKPIEADSKIVSKGRVNTKKYQQSANNGEAVKNNMAMDNGQPYSEPEQKASQIKKKQQE